MNNVERISTVIPKFKQQLMFLEEREKLFKQNHDLLTECADSSSSITTNSQPSAIITTNFQSSTFATESSADCLPKSPTDNSTFDQCDNSANIYVPFPDEYSIPSLPNGLIKDIEDGALIKFGPHYTNRQILIDAISYDLIEKYKLFYPSSTQFDKIGNAIVKFLKLPLTKENITIWKDALQTKLKRKRIENLDNIIVQDYRLKYSRAGSGRPVKRRLDETARRDRHKQMIIIPYNDEISNDIQTKANQLRDISQMDVHTQLKLWKETLHFRRQSISNRSTADILKDFPGYSNSLLVFEEVKMLMKIDLAAAIRRQIPALLNKMISTPVFITDSPPIRLMKILCKEFGETIQHLFCNNEPATPYPTLVAINDVIHIYVDFNSILSTNSLGDAVALLIAMYTIFELTFDKKSRTMRLLYSVLHAETRYLTNSVRILIKEKNIDIYAEQQHQKISNSSSNGSTTHTDESQSQSQIEMNSPSDPSVKVDSRIMSQSTEKKSSNDNPDSNSNVLFDTNESSNNIENTSSSNFNSQRQRKQRKRQKKNSSSDDQNSTYLIVAETNDHQLTTTNSIPLNDLTNSNFTSRTKRKRRL